MVFQFKWHTWATVIIILIICGVSVQMTHVSYSNYDIDTQRFFSTLKMFLCSLKYGHPQIEYTFCKFSQNNSYKHYHVYLWVFGLFKAFYIEDVDATMIGSQAQPCHILDCWMCRNIHNHIVCIETIYFFILKWFCFI